MFGWRLIPEDIYDKQQERIAELERREAELLDRVLLLQGQPPVSLPGQERLVEAEKQVENHLREMAEVYADEVGEESSAER